MICQTKTALAKALGVSNPTVHNWRKAGCPGLDHPPYDSDAIQAWVKQHDGRKDNDTTGKTAQQRTTTNELHEKKLRLEVELKEIEKQLDTYKLQIQTGQWLAVADVKQSQARMCSEVRKALEAIPAMYADGLRHQHEIGPVKAMLQRMVDDVLTRLSKGK